MPLHILAAVLTASLPVHGTLVPGRSLGGLRLGVSPTRVTRAWGPNHGVCAACARPTWYYNYARYEPQGACVEFSHGRVAAIFTVWSPTGWRTKRGLRMGDPATRITALYGRLPFEKCSTYDAYALVRGGSLTAFYVVNGKLWGFGLSLPSVPVCR